MFATKRVVIAGWLNVFLVMVAPPLAGGALGQTVQEKDLARVLGVQRALGEGRDAIARGDFAAAVQSMERQLGNIQGDKEFLALLRQAYQGHSNALRQSGNTQDADTYLRRLRILESGMEKNAPEVMAGTTPLPATPAVAREESEPPSALGARLTLPASKVEVVGAVPVVPGQALNLAGTPNKYQDKNTLFRGNLDDQPKGPKVVKESNPFSWDNSEDAHQFRSLLAGAETAFGKGDYEGALGLYTQAWQKQPQLPQSAKERWAYCRIHALTAKANRMGATPGFTAEFNKEASQVRALTNRFDQYLQKLGGTALQSSGSSDSNGSRQADDFDGVKVFHDPQPTGGWQIANTHHFRVFHKLERSSAERVAQVAERTRRVQGKRWFGEKAIAWETKCDLYVHSTGNEYSQATGVPPSSPGHSTVKVESGRVSHRRIDLHSDDPNMLEGVLPHETTHVVLAGNLGTGLVPRWADEGMSVLSEPQDRIERHTRQMSKMNQEGGLFPLKQLLELRDYPENGRVGVFYAQSVSVVQFMASLKGHQVFSQFLKDGMTQGYDSALRTHYGVQDWREMDQAWRATAFQGAAVASR